MRQKPNRFIFVINPIAGKGTFAKSLVQQVEAVCVAEGQAYEVYRTQAPGDGWRFVRDYPKREGEAVCFVACGGDGTLHEVANGAMERGDSVVATIPCGSGNDFVRIYPSLSFEDPGALLRGEVIAIDLLRCGERYTINTCNIGFDAKVAMNMQKFKRLPFVSGQMAYHLSVAYSVFGRFSQRYTLQIDGEEPADLRLILTAICNGTCCGGGYRSAPYARIDDGLIDLCGVRRISRVKLARLIGRYKEGEHAAHPQRWPMVLLRQCRSLHIRSDRPMTVCMDGEIFRLRELTVSIEPGALPFLLPAPR